MHFVPELVGDGVRLFDVSTLRASLTTLDVSAIPSNRAIASRQSGRASVVVRTDDRAQVSTPLRSEPRKDRLRFARRERGPLQLGQDRGWLLA